MSGGAVEVQAATENGTVSTLSVTAYVTRDQLMDGTFVPNESGKATNYGKLVFGKNENGNAQEWYILGKDTGVLGDNTIIFAASPMTVECKNFEEDDGQNKSFESGFGVYEKYPSEVSASHYGASELRALLQDMAKDSSYFTAAEHNLMNDTTVTTEDILNKDSNKNNLTYTTTDKLYALAAGGAYQDNIIKEGTNNQTILHSSTYWNYNGLMNDVTTYYIWLRSPYDTYGGQTRTLVAIPAANNHTSPGTTAPVSVDSRNFVQPASNLNLSSVLFASSAQAALSGAVSAGTITSGTAMNLRLDGTDTEIGAAYFDKTSGVIVADKAAAATGTVSLVVQGNDGTND